MMFDAARLLRFDAAMLSAHHLRFAFPGGGFSLRVAHFAAGAGEAVGIAGPSGTGKTTFLRLLAGILRPDEGSISIDGQPLADLAPAAQRRLRLRRLGLVFQDFALLDYLSVADNILLPLRLDGALTGDAQERARGLVERLEISRHWTRLCGELSQGERQRVAVARALAHRPRALLADEPTASLDASRKEAVMNLLLDHARESRAALVMVTHDPDLATRLDRTVNVEEWAA